MADITLWDSLVTLFSAYGVSLSNAQGKNANGEDEHNNWYPVWAVQTQSQIIENKNSTLTSMYDFYWTNVSKISQKKFSTNYSDYIDTIFKNFTLNFQKSIDYNSNGQYLNLDKYSRRLIAILSKFYVEGILSFTTSARGGEFSALYEEFAESTISGEDSILVKFLNNVTKDMQYKDQFNPSGYISFFPKTAFPVSGKPYCQFMIHFIYLGDNPWYRMSWFFTERPMNNFTYEVIKSGSTYKKYIHIYDEDGIEMSPWQYWTGSDGSWDRYGSGYNYTVSNPSGNRDNNNEVWFSHSVFTLDENWMPTYCYAKNVTYDGTYYNFESDDFIVSYNTISSSTLINYHIVDLNMANRGKYDDLSGLSYIVSDDIGTFSKSFRNLITLGSADDTLAIFIYDNTSLILVDDEYNPVNKLLTKDMIKDAIKDKLKETDNITDTGYKSVNESSMSLPAGLVSIYKMTSAQLSQLATSLWSDDIITIFSRIYKDPFDSIINLYAAPISISGVETNLKIGNTSIAATGSKITQNIQTKDFGYIDLTKLHNYNNYLDYDPYSQCQLYLPFSGYHSISMNDVAGSIIHITAKIELLSGMIMYEIHVSNNNIDTVFYTFSGNIATSVPITGQNSSRIISAGMSTIGSAAVGNIMGVASGLMDIAGSVALGGQVERSGSLPSNTGILGSMQPYILITRPVANIPDNFKSITGGVSNSYAIVSNITGYVEFEEFSLDDISRATNSEKTEIESILRSGFYV